MPFLFNIRNYSPEIINIQQNNTELNIILLRMNNFDIKQKKHGIYVLLYATNKIWGEKGYQNTAHFGQNTSFFRKN